MKWESSAISLHAYEVKDYAQIAYHHQSWFIRVNGSTVVQQIERSFWAVEKYQTISKDMQIHHVAWTIVSRN